MPCGQISCLQLRGFRKRGIPCGIRLVIGFHIGVVGGMGVSGFLPYPCIAAPVNMCKGKGEIIRPAGVACDDYGVQVPLLQLLLQLCKG